MKYIEQYQISCFQIIFETYRLARSFIKKCRNIRSFLKFLIRAKTSKLQHFVKSCDARTLLVSIIWLYCTPVSVVYSCTMNPGHSLASVEIWRVSNSDQWKEYHLHERFRPISRLVKSVHQTESLTLWKLLYYHSM